MWSVEVDFSLVRWRGAEEGEWCAVTDLEVGFEVGGDVAAIV